MKLPIDYIDLMILEYVEHRDTVYCHIFESNNQQEDTLGPWPGICFSEMLCFVFKKTNCFRQSVSQMPTLCIIAKLGGKVLQGCLRQED